MMIMKKIIHLTTKTICHVIVLRKALRWFLRTSLHGTKKKKGFARLLEFISLSVPTDDINYVIREKYEDLIINIDTKPNEHGGVSSIFWRGYSQYEPETSPIFTRLVESTDTFIDIGANWGYYTLLAAAKNPKTRIISFEPHPIWFDQIKKNIAVNNFKNIQVINKAVSHQCGEVIFYIDNIHPETSSLQKETFDNNSDTSKVIVASTTIDKFVEDNLMSQKPNIGLIKIDVEYFEGYVLEGARNTIRKFLPDMIIEILSVTDDEFKISNCEKIQNIIDEFGYKSFWISKHGLVREESVQGHDQSGGAYNYLLTKKSWDQVINY